MWQLCLPPAVCVHVPLNHFLFLPAVLHRMIEVADIAEMEYNKKTFSCLRNFFYHNL